MDETTNTDSGPSTSNSGPSNSGTPQAVFIEPQYPSHGYIPNDQLDSFLETESTSIEIPIEFVKCFTERIVEKSNTLNISKDIQYDGPYYGIVSITLPNSEKRGTEKRHMIDDNDSDKIPPNPRHYLGNYSATNIIKVLPPPKEDLVPDGKFWHFDEKQTIEFDTGNVVEKDFFSHINQMHKHRKEDTERVVFRVVSRLQPNTGASVITSYKVSALELMRRLTWPEFMCNAAVARVVKKEKKIDNFISTLKEICPKRSKTLRCPYPRYSAWSNFSEQEANKFAIDTGEILDAMPIRTINPGTDNIYEAIKQFEANLRNCVLFDRLTHTAGPPLIECIMHTFKKFILPCFPDAETELTLSQSQHDTDTDKYDDIDQSDEEQAQKVKQSRYRRKKSNEDEISLAQHGRKMVVVPKGRSKSPKPERRITRPRTKTTKRKPITPTSSTEEDAISVSSDSTPPSDNEENDPNYIEELCVTDKQESTSPIKVSKTHERSSDKFASIASTKFRKQFIQKFRDQFQESEREKKEKKEREKESGKKPTKKGIQTSSNLSRKEANKNKILQKLHKIKEDSSPGDEDSVQKDKIEDSGQKDENEDSRQKDETSDKEQAIKKSNIPNLQNLNVFDLIGKYRSETSESDRNQIKHLAGLFNKIVHDEKKLESGTSKTPTKETTDPKKCKTKFRIPLRNFVPLSVSSDTNSSPMFLSTSTESDLSGVGNPNSTASIPDNKDAPDSSFDKETDKELDHTNPDKEEYKQLDNTNPDKETDKELDDTNPDETELDIRKVKTEPCSDTEEERKRICAGFEYRNGKKYQIVLESVQDDIEDAEVMIVNYYKVSPPKFDMSKVKQEKEDSGNGPKPPGTFSETEGQRESEHTSHEEKQDSRNGPEPPGNDKQQRGQQGTSTKRAHGTDDREENNPKKMKISPPELSCSSELPLQINESDTTKKCGIENETSNIEVVEDEPPRDNKDMGSGQEEQVTLTAQESQNRLQQLAQLVHESAITTQPTPPVSPPLEFTPLSSVEEAGSHHIDVVGVGPDGTGTMPLKDFAPILQGLDGSQDSQDSLNTHENAINPPSSTEPDYMSDAMLLAAVGDSDDVQDSVVVSSPTSIGQKQEPVKPSKVMLQLEQANGEVIQIKRVEEPVVPVVPQQLQMGIDQSKQVESTEKVDTEVGSQSNTVKELNPDHAVDSSTELKQMSTNQKQTCADVHNEGSEEKEKRLVTGTDVFASVEFNCPISEVTTGTIDATLSPFHTRSGTVVSNVSEVSEQVPQGNPDPKDSQQVKGSALARVKATESMQLRSNKSGPSRSLGVRPSRNRTKKKDAEYMYN